MDEKHIGRAGLLSVREVAERNGISVGKALAILYSGGYFVAREPEDELHEEAQRCIVEGLTVRVAPVAGGYSAEFLVECLEGDEPIARSALLDFSRFGYSDTCWRCNGAARCRWSFQVIGGSWGLIEATAVAVLTEWSERYPTVDHAYLCQDCVQILGSPYVLIRERVEADEIEADRLYRLQKEKTVKPRKEAAPRVNVAVPLIRKESDSGSEKRLLIDDKLAAALALTPHRIGAKPVGDLFEVEIAPALGPMARIRLEHDAWTAYGNDGAELDLDDARIPVLRNIAFGACDLLAESGGSGPRRKVLDTDTPLPSKALHPSHRIRVDVGADFRVIVIEILLGRRQYETAMSEAIFVRGHWTHQPCGEGGRERRLLLRQPHYRGKGRRGGRVYELVVQP